MHSPMIPMMLDKPMAVSVFLWWGGCLGVDGVVCDV